MQQPFGRDTWGKLLFKKDYAVSRVYSQRQDPAGGNEAGIE